MCGCVHTVDDEGDLPDDAPDDDPMDVLGLDGGPVLPPTNAAGYFDDVRRGKCTVSFVCVGVIV